MSFEGKIVESFEGKIVESFEGKIDESFEGKMLKRLNAGDFQRWRKVFWSF